MKNTANYESPELTALETPINAIQSSPGVKSLNCLCPDSPFLPDCPQ